MWWKHRFALPAGTSAVRVMGPDGKEAPSQYENGKVIFVAKTPSVGYAVYDVEAAASGASASTLKVTELVARKRALSRRINTDGDVSSIFDKSLNKELLSAPGAPRHLRTMRRANGRPGIWIGIRCTPLRALTCAGPAQIRVVGKRTRARRGSKSPANSKARSSSRPCVSPPAMPATASNSRNAIDWKDLASNVKGHVRPLRIQHQRHLQLGHRNHPASHRRRAPVRSGVASMDRSHRQSGSYGATILTDVKNASDKYRRPHHPPDPDAHARRHESILPTSSTRIGAITKSCSASPDTRAIGARRRPIGRGSA